MVLAGQALEVLLLGVQQRHVRPIELIKAEKVEIDVERLHVQRPVRRIGDAVDADHGAGVVDRPGNGGDVVDGAQYVGTVAATHQPGFIA